jgi:hypothetical protein
VTGWTTAKAHANKATRTKHWSKGPGFRSRSCSAGQNLFKSNAYDVNTSFSGLTLPFICEGRVSEDEFDIPSPQSVSLHYNLRRKRTMLSHI